jgi:hypothetical protein
MAYHGRPFRKVLTQLSERHPYRRNRPSLTLALATNRQKAHAVGRQDAFCRWKQKPVVQTLAILLLMAVFAQAFFALVGGNFVAFTFFSARHVASGI